MPHIEKKMQYNVETRKTSMNIFSANWYDNKIIKLKSILPLYMCVTLLDGVGQNAVRQGFLEARPVHL